MKESARSESGNGNAKTKRSRSAGKLTGAQLDTTPSRRVGTIRSAGDTLKHGTIRAPASVSALSTTKKSTGLDQLPSYSFTLPGVTLSQNQLDGRHWWVKHEQKTYWHEAVGYIARKCPVEPSRARVHIVRVSKRLIDPLNVPAGCKWLLDAFVELGWLTGDGYNDLVVTTEQRKCAKGEEPQMEVEIQYLPR